MSSRLTWDLAGVGIQGFVEFVRYILKVRYTLEIYTKIILSILLGETRPAESLCRNAVHILEVILKILNRRETLRTPLIRARNCLGFIQPLGFAVLLLQQQKVSFQVFLPALLDQELVKSLGRRWALIGKTEETLSSSSRGATEQSRSH